MHGNTREPCGNHRAAIAVLFRNLSGLQNECSDDQAAKQEWVEEKGEVGTLSCTTKFQSDITSERTEVRIFSVKQPQNMSP